MKRKRRKTEKVKENERDGVKTAHPHCTPMLRSEVHLQFMLTITTPLRKRVKDRT